MSTKRASKGIHFPEGIEQIGEAKRRQEWLSSAKKGFVASPANRRYYGIILDILWPEGCGIPGPPISESTIRVALDDERRKEGKAPYVDPFRRMRELQGDEGFKGIVKEGTKYQLQSLDLAHKRVRREKPSTQLWEKIKKDANNKCACCEQQEPNIQLSPDHKIPRAKGGDNSDGNYQPLCEQCNNRKSAACGRCTSSNCNVCHWARPETYKEIILTDENRERIRRDSFKKGTGQSEEVNRILASYYNEKSR